jgi:cell fate (sporulation/competence/biofilm development) regulator YlbF (YheA/YmcA/DUF963 family)|tara:strand:+ start:1224 stop:1418 length:195 start_codon:yes stop_codon:yes gene_type:complete
MAQVNKELIDKRFMQIDGKMKTLKFILSRGESVARFKEELNNLEEIITDLKSQIDRIQDPMRNG